MIVVVQHTHTASFLLNFFVSYLCEYSPLHQLLFLLSLPLDSSVFTR
jgi:hypothetical protein